MSLSPFNSFQSRFVTYLLNFPRIYYITEQSDPYLQLLLSTFKEHTLRKQVSRKAFFGNGADSITLDEYLKLSRA